MHEEFDPMSVYRELKEKQERGGQLHPNAAVTRKLLADLERCEARMGELPEDERDPARALILGWLASRAIGELEERIVALELHNYGEGQRRTFEELQFRSYGGGR